MPVLDPLRRAVANDRLAHAFLVVGSPDGLGRELAEAMVQLLFCTAAEKPCGACEGCQRIAHQDHPDVYWLEPAKKSRIFSVDQIRALNQSLAQTAYAGGWKAAVLLHAERMNDAAMNALLKTMEEPPGRTLLILVTDQSQGLLPTIISRCQRINLGEMERPPEAPWRAELETWLAGAGGRGPLTILARANRLQQLLDEVKAAITREEEGSDAEADDMESGGGDEAASEDEAGGGDDDDRISNEVRAARVQARLVKERSGVLRTIQLWQRDLLACRLGGPDVALHFPQARETLVAQAVGLDVAALLGRIDAVDAARRRLDTNINSLLVLETLVQSGI